MSDSIREAMDQATADLAARDSKSDDRADKADAKDDKVPRETSSTPDDDWADGPGYIKKWKKEAREALRAYASDPEKAEAWKHIREQLDGTHKYLGQVSQGYAQYEKRYAPLNDLLSQAEKQYAMCGMDLGGGLRQQMAVAEALAQNPDATLPWLASLYKPKDAGSVIKAIAQASGLDLNQLVQQAPYVDPAVTQMVNPMMQRMQQLEQALYQRDQQSTQYQQQQVVSHLRSFESAVDASGNRLHPYIDDPEVKQMMIYAINAGVVNRDLAQAYAWAVERHIPAIQAKAKAADTAALADAARTTATSQHAKQASNNLNGTAARGRPGNDKPSLREAMLQADKQLGLTSPSA